MAAVYSGMGFGIVEIVAGGVMQGTFAIGMKRAQRWSWENIWFVYSIVGLLIFPAVITLYTVPNIWAVYRAVQPIYLFAALVFGFGWGAANVLCGLAFPRVGIALSFAVVVGLSSSLGSLVPLLFLARRKLTQPSGWCILGGVAVALIGIALLGNARRRWELDQQGSPRSLRDMRIGLLFCVLAGVLAPMLNFSFAFGARISDAAGLRGATPANAVNAVWFLALFGGLLANGGYCLVLFAKHRTMGRFFEECSLSHWLLSGLMGFLWSFGLFCYGWGANHLGEMRAIVGWPMFQAVAIIASTGAGITTGEWDGVPPWFIWKSCAGLFLLTGAFVLIGYGNNL